MIDTKALAALLPEVEKPARYTGGEWNACTKTKGTRFLFAFPDAYEVGMSHLGTSILYHLVNARPDASAERAYAPFPDMQKAMAGANIPLYSLETYTPASEFDIIGINLSYEMCYTTVLRLLQLAGLPLLAKDRPGLPLVVGGGACTCNPEPVADFFDLFMVGDGEEVMGQLLDLFGKHKDAFDKKAFLAEAAEIEGVYVPSLYHVDYNEDGTVAEIHGKPVSRRIVADMDSAFYPESFLVPNTGIVHDRATLEIFRGCTRGCRFCQAGYWYRPVREKQPETLLKQARKLIDATGYEEISLTSLSSGDYSQIDRLACQLLEDFAPEHVSVSLPSLRIDSFEKEYAKRMQGARKSSFTFAPEAGTQRLRDVINKNITEEEILRGVSYAFESGATTLKLYFMVGLPTETFEDLDGLVELVKQIRGRFYALPKNQRKGSLQLNVSTSCFVPKPCTPFQWEGQDDRELLRQKQAYLKEKLRIPGVRYSWHDPRLSFLEAVFARGDRRLSEVLRLAAEGGAMFDSWQDHFRWDLFEQAFQTTGLDPNFYATRIRDTEELLPWSHIDCGVCPEYLKAELRLAREGKTTPDCREGCQGCGLESWCAK